MAPSKYDMGYRGTTLTITKFGGTEFGHGDGADHGFFGQLAAVGRKQNLLVHVELLGEQNLQTTRLAAKCLDMHQESIRQSRRHWVP